MDFKVVRNKNYCPSSPDHRHHRPSGCSCTPSMTEPADNCPTHGGVDMRRCDYCQRFMKNDPVPEPYMTCYDCGDCAQCEAISR